MKKKIILLVFLAALSACTKVEQEPLQNLTIDKIYDPTDVNADFARQALTDLYTYLPDGFNRINGDMLDDASGDAIPSRSNTTVEYYTNGRLNSTNNPDDCYANSYKAIRAANVFLANVDVSAIDATNKQYWKAEARFIRAMSYWEMVKRYGGVPLIGDKQLTPQDNLQILRNTFEECVNYMVSECDAIKTLLRTEPVVDGDIGRITRGCAYALKARILLYAASPLYNGGGISSDANMKKLTGYPTSEDSRWTTALNAYQDLINLNVYSLVTYTATGTFNSVFLNRKSVEVIMAKQRPKTFDIETNNAPISYSPATSYGYTSPTQELVDAFPMSNGLPITDAASGYSAATPYVGRDTRFYATIFYNGINWLTKPVETFEGGKDKPGGTAIQTKTAYYMKKFMADYSTGTATSYGNQDHNFIYFRYGEVLLAYAECLNEVGRTTDAYAPLKQIRTRALIPAGTGSLYGLKANMSQVEMRAAIQNERRIECAFEEQRFWDIRRWKIADQVLNGTLHGVTITKVGTALTYTPSTVSTVSFANKMYNMPLPYNEVITDLKLIQNEGW